jgi:CheY-like chemotaxis protein
MHSEHFHHLNQPVQVQRLGQKRIGTQLVGHLDFVVEIMERSDTREQQILLVEDNDDDVLLIMRAFQRAGVKRRVQAVTTGIDAIAYLKGDAPFDDRAKYPLPGLVLLDIKMPGTDGFDVLRWIRQQLEYSHLCVVMLTSSDLIRDVNQAYRLGADSFLV